MASSMWKISNNSVNRASIWTPYPQGPQALCCTPFPAGQVEQGLHSQFPYKPFQRKNNQFFSTAPTFPEHGECCADYGPPTFIA